jgi:predicted enzyme related to lactoylglutathione lyase
VTEISVFRPGDVSYLRIAAPDPARSAAFYNAVFGWKIRKDSTAFADGTGHVIGHFMADRVPGVGGEVTTKPYPEGDLWVAMTRDPAGNAIGVWQHGPRPSAP